MKIQTDCEIGFFISSSGHCSLDCSYCVASPVVKHHPSLNGDDLDFLLDSVAKPAFLIFSGRGDFFAGYHKNDRFLERVLRRDVEVALDVNGVMIHEFSELDEAMLAKIRYFNLTFHYSELRRKGALSVWVRNASLIIERMMPLIGHDFDTFIVDMIVTPGEQGLWDEALAFYQREVWAKTGKQLLLQRDVLSQFTQENNNRLDSMIASYGNVIEKVHQEDFQSRFADFDYVECPAGSRYFRIWNNGQVQGCPFVPQIQNMGNLKERRFNPIDHRIRCGDARHCDCNAIAQVGWMEFPEAARINKEAL